jgi:hypothetical protein
MGGALVVAAPSPSVPPCHASPQPVAARKVDAPAAVQAAIVNVAELSSISGGG